MTGLDGVRQDYRAAFLRYLPQRDEAALHLGYKIGRSAVVDRLSLLDVVQIHHAILLEVLRDTSSENLTVVATAASEFLLEVLATYDMTQRSLRREP